MIRHRHPFTLISNLLASNFCFCIWIQFTRPKAFRSLMSTKTFPIPIFQFSFRMPAKDSCPALVQIWRNIPYSIQVTSMFKPEWIIFACNYANSRRSGNIILGQFRNTSQPVVICVRGKIILKINEARGYQRR